MVRTPWEGLVTVKGYMRIMKTFRVDSRLMIKIVCFWCIPRHGMNCLTLQTTCTNMRRGISRMGSISACLVGTSIVLQISRTKFLWGGETIKSHNLIGKLGFFPLKLRTKREMSLLRKFFFKWSDWPQWTNQIKREEAPLIFLSLSLLMVPHGQRAIFRANSQFSPSFSLSLTSLPHSNPLSLSSSFILSSMAVVFLPHCLSLFHGCTTRSTPPKEPHLTRYGESALGGAEMPRRSCSPAKVPLIAVWDTRVGATVVRRLRPPLWPFLGMNQFPKSSSP